MFRSISPVDLFASAVVVDVVFVAIGIVAGNKAWTDKVNILMEIS